MIKQLNSKAHGYIDFAVIAAFFLMPSILGLSETPKQLSYLCGAMHTGLVFLTAFPFGIIKLVPFQVHGMIEVLLAVFLAAAPWAFDFAYEAYARNYYLGLGLGYALVWMATDYRAVSLSIKSRASFHVRTAHL